MERRTSAAWHGDAGTFGLIGDLVEAAEAGDRERFDVIFERCFTRVFAIAWKVVRDRRRAEELTASVLLDAVGHRP